MELREPRPGFSLDALIAEAKRRARERRLLGLLLLVVVAAVVAAVTFGSPGGGSRPGGGVGKVGNPSSGSHSVQVGPLSVSVLRRFHVLTGGRRDVEELTISNVLPLAPNGVELDIDYLSSAAATALKTAHLPLGLQELHGTVGDSGRTWNGLVSGGGSVYSVILFMGSKAPAADRAAILRALSSIHRTR